MLVRVIPASIPKAAAAPLRSAVEAPAIHGGRFASAARRHISSLRYPLQTLLILPLTM